MHIKRPHAPRNQPVNSHAWAPGSEPPSSDDTVRRRASGRAAAAEVRLSASRLEADITQATLVRLRKLRDELLAQLRSQPSDFKRWHTEALLRNVDQLLAETQADLARMAGRAYSTAADLGGQVPQQALSGASYTTAVPAGVSPALVRHAYDATLDLLSEPMARLRAEIRAGVRRLALSGESFGREWSDLTARIEADGLAGAEYRAERIIRTELGRVLNGASFEQMQALAARFPFIRKIWIRTADSRTRVTHIDAGSRYKRGHGIPVSERFAVGKVQLRFPLDPTAEPAGKLAASETIMCRCTASTDFDLAEMRQHGAQRISLSMV